MEDEPYEAYECGYKNTQCIIVISSALKASITTVVKKKKKKDSYAAQNSPQENPEKRKPTTEQMNLLLISPACEWVIGLHNWNSTCNILFRGTSTTEEHFCSPFILFFLCLTFFKNFLNTVANKLNTWHNCIMHNSSIGTQFKWLIFVLCRICLGARGLYLCSVL